MGSGREQAAVADAGPLIHLAEVGGLALLDVFETLLIPDVVWSETVEQGRVLEADVVGLDNVQRVTLSQAEVTQFTHNSDLGSLQAGECHCLFLCQLRGVPLLLTDDLAVREVAKRFNFTAVGCLGIVVRAYRLRKISFADAESYIVNLYEVSSLFVTRAIVELAIEQLRQSGPD